MMMDDDSNSKINTYITYERIVCPASMRSSYWKFFGFPANASGAIISRAKIICSICKAAISYNRNTSNLRAHLHSKHSEFVKKFFEETPSGKTQYVYVGTDRNDNNAVCVGGKADDCPIIASVKVDNGEKVKNETEISVDDAEQLIGILAEEIVEDDQKETFETARDFVDVEYLSTLSEDHPYKIVDVPPVQLYTTMHDPIDAKKGTTTTTAIIEDALKIVCDMLTTDLLPINMVEGHGFQKFIKTLNPNVELPTNKTIEIELKNRYKSRHKAETATLIRQLKNNRFSLGFELWTNVEQKSFISLYVTYVRRSRLESKLLVTVDSNHTDWSSHFECLNMDQCTAAVTNFNVNEYTALSQYLSSNEISTVPCFISLISEVVNRCFATPVVSDALRRAIEFIHETSGLLTSDVYPPEIHENCWLTKYEFFEYFTEVYFNTFEVTDADLQNLCADIKSILECLKPLKVTLDTIQMEQVALASLLKPLSQQLMDSHYTLFETDTAIELELKPIIQDGLEKSILSKRFLSIASFLDPRLQTLMIFDDAEIEIIKEQIKQICKYKDREGSLTQQQNENEPSKAKRAKSGLGFFFGNKEQKAIVQKTKNAFEREFNCYSEDVNEAFDQCPLSWWSDCGSAYPILKEASIIFNCVPAMLCSKNSMYNRAVGFENNRSILYGETVEACLWLHFNTPNE